MKSCVLHIARLITVTLLAVGVTAAPPNKDETAVLAALTKACDGFESGDVSYLTKFLAPDFTLTGSDGAVTTRDENLAEVRAREPRYEVFRNHDMKVRLYGDTALVNGITSIKGTSKGKPFAVEVQFTDTLIRKDGAWLLVASDASPLAK